MTTQLLAKERVDVIDRLRMSPDMNPVKHDSKLQWCHNEHHCVPDHRPHDYLHNRLFRRRAKKTSKLRVTGLCAGNSPVTGEFPAQRASDAENLSIWSRRHDMFGILLGVKSGRWINLPHHLTMIASGCLASPSRRDVTWASWRLKNWQLDSLLKLTNKKTSVKWIHLVCVNY